MNGTPNLSERGARQIAALMDLQGPVGVTAVKQFNHIYGLTCGSAAFYLKSYTKDWYSDDVARTAGCVLHEQHAWTVLRQYGLAAPDVALTRYDLHNPLGRPFSVTRQLDSWTYCAR